MTVDVYTDGSCFPNPNGLGGWAFVAVMGMRTVERYGHIPVSTNNVSELIAIREALLFVKLTEHELNIWTDSKYCKNALTVWRYGWEANGWLNSVGSEVANKELIEDIVELIEEHRKVRQLDIKWTKGHAGHAYNELADSLASFGRKKEGSYIPYEDIS